MGSSGALAAAPAGQGKELFEMAREIDRACSDDSLGLLSGRTKCQSLCGDGLCCFEDGEHGCAGDPSRHCVAYAGCHNLVSAPTDNVDQATPMGSSGAPAAAPAGQVEELFEMAREIDRA